MIYLTIKRNTHIINGLFFRLKKKHEDSNMCCLSEKNFNQKVTSVLKVNGQKTKLHDNTNKKKSEVAIYIIKVYFRIKNTPEIFKISFHDEKEYNSLRGYDNPTLYVPNSKGLKYMSQYNRIFLCEEK